jgi:hypothetical protein
MSSPLDDYMNRLRQQQSGNQEIPAAPANPMQPNPLSPPVGQSQMDPNAIPGVLQNALSPISPNQAFNTGKQIGQTANEAQAMDQLLNTMAYSQASGSDACRQGSGGMGADGGGCQPCGGKGGGGGLAKLYGLALCSVATMHGFIDINILKADYEQIHRFDNKTRSGYYLWALPLAKFLEKHPIIFKYTIAPLVKSWAEHMAYLNKTIDKDNIFGNFLEFIGVPLCKLLSYLNPNKEYK